MIPTVAFILSTALQLMQDTTILYEKEDLAKSIKKKESEDGFPKIETYDYIIVGGGTAGGLLANRLSRAHTVLLLEKGGTPVPETNNPVILMRYSGHPAFNDFYTYPVRSTDGTFIRQASMAAGRMLGGSGSHNHNHYNRGNPADYESFANLTGDSTFRYENVVEYYKRLENFRGWLVDDEEVEGAYGNYGPITLETTPKDDPLLQAWFKAGKELGFPVADPNLRQQTSFTPMVYSEKHMRKMSSYTAFIKPIENSRKKLTIHRYSTVERILFKKTKAYGVVFKRHGFAGLAHAKKEIIISAGTLASPLLLMKSGIGPESVLKEAEIPIVATSPGVGLNLQNHQTVAVTHTPSNIQEYEKLFLHINSEEQFEAELSKFHARDSTGLLPRRWYQAFLPSQLEDISLQQHPDIQFILKRDTLGGSLKERLNVFIGRSRSTGSIILNSTQYKLGERENTKLAVIDYNYFKDANDLTVLESGVQTALKLFQTTPFSAVDFKVEKNFTLCQDDENFWKCFIDKETQTAAHWAGTCKMGRKTDPFAVVDSDFRVIGVDNLRVVDASVLPHVTNANINAPVLVFAEIAAEKILNAY